MAEQAASSNANSCLYQLYLYAYPQSWSSPPPWANLLWLVVSYPASLVLQRLVKVFGIGSICFTFLMAAWLLMPL
jgi:hypothetical protein